MGISILMLTLKFTSNWLWPQSEWSKSLPEAPVISIGLKLYAFETVT